MYTSSKFILWGITTLHPTEWPVKTPTGILYTLKSKLALKSPLWVCSGSSPESLQPIYDSFEVTQNEVFMDYSLAEVDRAICKGVTSFWGMRRSSFSLDLDRVIRAKGGNSYWYT